MTAPTFCPATGGRQPIDTNSRHVFALNNVSFTVTIEAANFGNSGVDFQFAPDGKTWASVLSPRGPVHRVYCHHFQATAGAYRFVSGDATGVTTEIMTP